MDDVDVFVQWQINLSLQKKTVDYNIWMAPLHGITDWVFRSCYTRHFGGIDISIAPFVSINSNLKEKRTKFFDLFHENNQVLPVIPQVMANQSSQLNTAANILAELGYTEFNWNLGCPSSQVTKHGRGAGLLKTPDRIEEILNEYFFHSKMPISIKIRIGYNSVLQYDRIIEILNKYPLSFICLHPRLASQMYEGQVDLNAFERLVKNTNHRVIYSGDITDKKYFDSLRQNFPSVKDWMIGRGLMTDLNLMHDLNPECPEMNVEKFMEFYHDILQKNIQRFDRENPVLGKMKELWRYFICNDILNHVDLKGIMRSQSLNEMNSYIEKQKSIQL